MRHSRILTLAAVLLAAASTATAGNTAAYGRQTAPSARAAVDSHFGPSVDVSTGETGIATVHCPQGEVPTGGGGLDPTLFSGNPFAITNSFPQGDVWVVSALNTTSSTKKLAAFVLCSTAAHTVVESGSGFLNPGNGASPTVTCPAGQVTSGGGVHSSGTEVNVSSLAATSSSSWSVQVINNSGSVQSSKAVVICSTAPHSGQTGTAKAIAPHSTGVAFATCPQGQVPTGGGVVTDSPRALVSSLTSTGSDWDAGVVNLTNSTVHATAQVICTTP
ncbi:hypothetical protein [Kitasatospora kifunensis]|uniref:Uncharacterized protein n=1 Tax=Kitasatospora kifunensis TaxID=58351 RepID=A0A7W7RB17_KITKI|nr:hypothetical protein [Kitasatospora kifunensis]MBB4928388.1 hypothetical protein [Kitasatospora kifunensis]